MVVNIGNSHTAGSRDPRRARGWVFGSAQMETLGADGGLGGGRSDGGGSH